MKANESVWKKVYIIGLVEIAVMLFTMVNGKVIWFDEAFSLQLAKLSVSDVIKYTASDVHPPLYYLILRAFVKGFGESIVLCHIVSIIPFIAMLIVVGDLFARKFSYKEAFIAVIVVAGAPNVMSFALEIRMYSMAMLTVLLSFLTAYAIVESGTGTKKQWILFAVANAVAAYLHYFAGAAVIVISIITICMLLIFCDDRKDNFVWWIISSVVTVVLYLPWLFVFFRQLSDVRADYWIPPFSFSDINNYLEFSLGQQQIIKKPLMAVMLVTVIVCIFLIKKNNENVRLIIMSLATYAGFILLGIGLSIAITPVFVERYISVVLVFLWIGVMTTFFSLDKTYIRTIMFIAGEILLITSFIAEDHHRTSDENITVYSVLAEEMHEGDAIVNTSAHTLGQMVYYFPEEKEYIKADVISSEAFQDWDEVSNTVYISDFSEIQDETLWVLCYNTEDAVTDELKACGYNIQDMGTNTLGYDGWRNDYMEIGLYRCSR